MHFDRINNRVFDLDFQGIYSTVPKEEILPSQIRKHHGVLIPFDAINTGTKACNLSKVALLQVTAGTALRIISGKTCIKE